MKRVSEAAQAFVEKGQAARQQAPQNGSGLLKKIVATLAKHEAIPLEGCFVCQGAGWFYSADGKAPRCPLHVTVERSKREAGLVIAAGGMTVEYPTAPWPPQPRHRAQDVAMKALEGVLKRGGGMVYVWGPPGSGKSFVVRSFTLHAARQPWALARPGSVRYLEGHMLAAAFQEAVGTGTVREVWTEFAAIKVLVIDEADKIRMTPYLQDQFFSLLNYRYEAGKAGRAITVLAANEGPDFFGPYVASRLRDQDNFVIPFQSIDLRQGGEP